MRGLYTDEGGISPIVATLLLVNIFIGIFAIYMTITIPGEFASKEKEHMSEVRDSFLKLQSAVQEMSAGESRNITVPMSANLVSGTFRGPNIGGRLAVSGTSIILEDTIAMWYFDEGSGDNVYDVTANNNDGTIVGAVDWVPGRYDTGLKFQNTGSPEYVSVPPSSSLDFVSGDFTVELWVKPNIDYDGTTGDGWRFFVRQDNQTNTNEWRWYIWAIGFNGWDDKVEFVLKNTDGTEFKAEPSSTTTLSAGTWYHIAGVKEGNDLKLYINGVLQGTGTFSGSHPSSENVYISWEYKENLIETFDGVIDEVRIMNRALTASEMTMYGSSYFEIQNAFYSPQIYVYEHGAVILVQPPNNKSLMISPPTMIDVTPYGVGDDIRVRLQTIQLMGSSEVTSTGTETLMVSVENTWQTSMPSQPNMESATIVIYSNHRDAWKDYFVTLVGQLRDDGIYVTADFENLQLIIHGKNTAPGVKDIYFLREFKEVSATLS